MSRAARRGKGMTDEEMVTKQTAAFRKDWPAIKRSRSKRAMAVKQIAAMYKRHQDWPTFAMLIAAHTAWRERGPRKAERE